MRNYIWSKNVGKRGSAAATFNQQGAVVVWKEDEPNHYHVTAFWNSHMILNYLSQHKTLELCMSATEIAIEEEIDRISQGIIPDITFDSRPDTWLHISRVRELLSDFTMDILERSLIHDASKLYFPEKDAFDNAAGTVLAMELGSAEYHAHMKSLKPVLEHHYRMNSHHPEHHPEGIDGMSLTDLVEMLHDWKASSERYSDKTVKLTLLRERFGLSQQLFNIFCNEVTLRGWEWV